MSKHLDRIEKWCNKMETKKSLFVINKYINKILYNKDISARITYDHTTINTNTFFKKGIIDYKLLQLTKFIIIYSGKYKVAKKDISQRKDFTDILNEINELESDTNIKHLEKDVRIGIHRLMNRQFERQRYSLIRALSTYYKIYNETNINNLIYENFRFTTKDLYLAGILLFTCFQIEPAHKKSDILKYPLLKNEKRALTFLINNISQDKETLRNEINDIIQISKDTLAGTGKIIKKPLIIEDNTLICPIPNAIIKNITSNLRLIFHKTKGFSLLYGNSYEKLIGNRFNDINENKKNNIKKGDKNKIREKKGKPSFDRYMTDKTGIVFIESKTYQPTESLKQLSIGEEEKCLKEIKSKYIQTIIQMYKSLNSYMQGNYNQIEEKFTEGKNINLLIVYLEDRYIDIILQNKKIHNQVEQQIKRGLMEKGIPITLYKEYPVEHCSIVDFEEIIFILQESDIGPLFKEKHTNEKYLNHSMSGYLNNHFKNHINKKRKGDATLEKIFQEMGAIEK